MTDLPALVEDEVSRALLRLCNLRRPEVFCIFIWHLLCSRYDFGCLLARGVRPLGSSERFSAWSWDCSLSSSSPSSSSSDGGGRPSRNPSTCDVSLVLVLWNYPPPSSALSRFATRDTSSCHCWSLAYPPATSNHCSLLGYSSVETVHVWAA